MPDDKTCFVISPIGGDDAPTRKWADQTIKHLIRPAVEPCGLEVLRADQEDRAGIITTHIIQRLVSSKLVIADLTWRNPNVFYELAVRHVTRKPLVQIINAEEEIPFDVQGMRTVKFELSDPDALEVAREALARQVGAVLEEEQLETPISQAVGQQVAIESGDPAQVEIAELAQAVQALTAEVRGRSASPQQSVATVNWVSKPMPIKWYGGGEPIELDVDTLQPRFPPSVADGPQESPKGEWGGEKASSKSSRRARGKKGSK